MSYCLAQDCNKKTTCSRWCGNCPDNQLYTSVDYSTMGSGGANQPDIWYCGNKGLYKLYEEIPQTKSSNKGIMLFGTEEDLAFMKEKFSLLPRSRTALYDVYGVKNVVIDCILDYAAHHALVPVGPHDHQSARSCRFVIVIRLFPGACPFKSAVGTSIYE